MPGKFSIRLLAFVSGLALLCGLGRALMANDLPTIKAPEPNRADEPLAGKLSFAKAAEFLDAANLQWTQQRKCGSCHTNYPYLMARPLLKEANNSAAQEIRHFFEDRAANWETAKPRWDTEVVATAAALAFNDAQTTGKLHPLTRKALDWMWKLQRPDGAWNWLKCNWPPMEADDYFGVTNALLGVGIAPEKYSETEAARDGLARIRTYLQKTPPPSLHHKTMLLWDSCLLPDLMTAAERQATVKELLAVQREDGGWSLPSLGEWKRHSGEPNDKAASPSDGYATGFVVYVLRQAGLPKDDAAMRRAVEWLRTHQRESGRWFTRSVNDDKHHYIAHAGSAFAVMALRSCDASE